MFIAISTQVDIAIATIPWLNDTIDNSYLFQSLFDVYRYHQDCNAHGGGVFLLIHNVFLVLLRLIREIVNPIGALC